MTRPIPPGYQRVTPMLVVRNIRQTIDFYQRAFGAVTRTLLPNPDGKGVMHAEIMIGNAILMFGEENPQQPCRSAETLGSSPVSFYLYLEDVDAAFATAVAAGAVVNMPLAEMFWGDRCGTVQDPFGYSWTLATHTRDLSPQEIDRGAQDFFSTMTGPELVITRTFAAPRERLWQAWTEPELLQRWWGPKGFTAPVCRLDLRVGGTYLNCMRSAEGQNFWSTGVFREIVAPERLVYSDSFADEQGNVVPASVYGMEGDWPLELLVTVSFVEEAGNTVQTLRHSGIPVGEMRTLCAAGWNESFDKLAALLSVSA